MREAALWAVLCYGVICPGSAFNAGSGALMRHSLTARAEGLGQPLLLVSTPCPCTQTLAPARRGALLVGSPLTTALGFGSGGGSRGGVSVWGNGGGGGGGGDDEQVDGEVAALLKQYNLRASDLPPGALALGAEKLSRFLAAYANGLNRWLINSWPAWRDKMLADPEFAYKLMIEQTVGLSIAMSGTAAARGKDLLKELDFFLTDVAVGAVLNFVLIWLLAPSVAAQTGKGALAKYVGTLPSFVLAEGKYSVGQRAMAGLYKGSLFAACGFMGSVGGTSVAFALIKIRQLLDPANNADKPLPNVIANSFGWASFMFVSTNPRYQLVNGLERVISGMCPPAVSKASSLVIRTGNNLIGGATWVRHFFR